VRISDTAGNALSMDELQGPTSEADEHDHEH